MGTLKPSGGKNCQNSKWSSVLGNIGYRAREWERVEIQRRHHVSHPMAVLQGHTYMVQMRCTVVVPSSSSRLQKPLKTFESMKRYVLDWSLRATHSARNARGCSGPPKIQKSKTAPCEFTMLSEMEHETHPRRRRRKRENTVDVDTIPSLEPYRREVVAQQPTTFGHRPLSALRMFNPCTMDTSRHRFNSASNTNVNKPVPKHKVRKIWRGAPSELKSPGTRFRTRVHMKKGAPGLSALMLKALLHEGKSKGELARGLVGTEQTGRKTKAHVTTNSHDIADEYFRSLNTRHIADAGRGGRASEQNLSNISSPSLWREPDSTENKYQGKLNASGQTCSSRCGAGNDAVRVQGSSPGEVDLRRLFSLDVSLPSTVVDYTARKCSPVLCEFSGVWN